MSTHDLVRQVAEYAGLPLDDGRIDELVSVVDGLLNDLQSLRRLDPDGVEQLEPAFTFLPTAWMTRPA
jgi:hypothetical protein